MVENKGFWSSNSNLKNGRKIRILALEFELKLERSNSLRLCKLEEKVKGLRVRILITRGFGRSNYERRKAKNLA